MSAQPDRVGFLPEVLDRTVIAIPLLHYFDDEHKQGRIFEIIIDLNLEFQGGIEDARLIVEQMIREIVRDRRGNKAKQGVSHTQAEGIQYVFTSLDAESIKELVRRDRSRGPAKADRAIYHIWPDFKLKPLITTSISTVKADAAHASFSAFGDGIVWAVVDSGIDGAHPHFRKHRNLELTGPLQHRDFTSAKGNPLADVYGHGTHVAGIIAGEMTKDRGPIVATTRYRDENGRPTEVTTRLDAITGMAPRCKLLSLKVLDDDGSGNGTGRTSSIIAAIQYIQKLNGHGRRILVHGVNLSVGYDFEPEWFACGQSPLCVEVDRLVRSGVIVVVAAGNSGYGFAQSEQQGLVAAGLDLTINDPGNAELAITVGSTHREMPHIYGVSYFSSKGPTGDGRMKPDLLAPGEKIVSCASSNWLGIGRARRAARKKATRHRREARYREDSGTSMAAPHVSGVIAAFLSIRREFIRSPEEVKRIFLSTATNLNRAPYFQGSGLIDLMRAIQSV
jgi:serine protease AprX